MFRFSLGHFLNNQNWDNLYFSELTTAVNGCSRCRKQKQTFSVGARVLRVMNHKFMHIYEWRPGDFSLSYVTHDEILSISIERTVEVTRRVSQPFCVRAPFLGKFLADVSQAYLATTKRPPINPLHLATYHVPYYNVYQKILTLEI